MAGAAVMSGWGSMAERVAAYLEARRAMGYQLRIEGEQLQRFARFADQQDHRGPLTLDLAVAWASQSHTASGIVCLRQLCVTSILQSQEAMRRGYPTSNALSRVCSDDLAWRR